MRTYREDKLFDELESWKEECGNLNVELLIKEAENNRLREQAKIAERVCVKQLGELGRLREALNNLVSKARYFADQYDLDLEDEFKDLIEASKEMNNGRL